jgi:hypothetical protein
MTPSGRAEYHRFDGLPGAPGVVHDRVWETGISADLAPERSPEPYLLISQLEFR